MAMCTHTSLRIRWLICLFMTRSEPGAPCLAMLAGSESPSVFVSLCRDCKHEPLHPHLTMSAEDLGSQPYAYTASTCHFQATG